MKDEFDIPMLMARVDQLEGAITIRPTIGDFERLEDRIDRCEYEQQYGEIMATLTAEINELRWQLETLHRAVKDYLLYDVADLNAADII